VKRLLVTYRSAEGATAHVELVADTYVVDTSNTALHLIDSNGGVATFAPGVWVFVRVLPEADS